MAYPFNLASLVANAPANQVVDENLINARNIFGIQDPYLLKDYTDYYMDKPVPITTDEGIVTLPIDTNVINQGGGEGEREELGPVSPRNIRNTGDNFGAKLVSRVNNTGGITNAPIDMENIGAAGIEDILGGNFATFGPETLRGAPDVFDVDKVGIKNPSIMKIANYNDLFTDERFSLPENIQKRNKGIFSIRDFLPGGKYSLSGMAISGLKGISDRIQSSNLAKSTSLADYRDMMSYGGYEEREAAREKTMQEARDLQKLIDLRKTSIPTDQDRGRGQPPPGPKTKTRDYGRDSTPNNPTSTKNKTKSKGYNYANTPGGGRDGNGNGGGGGSGDGNSPDGGGSYCFDPRTLIQMANGSTKQIKNIQLGDATKGGEVTGVFQFKASDEIHDYKGVTVAGSHYVKEDGRFIMVKDSPLSVKINKIPVVYSLDTSNRRIFINDIEFADYNGDGVAKNFLTNAGVNLSGFDKEVLRQVENRLI